jgi:hypothetical protein
VTRTDGTTARLYDLFHNGLFVLLEAAAPEGNGATAEDGAGLDGTARDAAANGLPDQVRRVLYTRCTGSRLPAATLVRPDGYVAWASDARDPRARAQAVRAAVHRWCG